MDEAERHAAGMKVRRTILGHGHVDRSVANQSELNAEFQDLIVRYAWGEIWTRPGLDHRTRRLLVLSTTAAMGRWEEFRLHVRAGLEGGLALDDIKEALLQLAVYAGVPAGNTAFHIVEDVMGQLGIKQGK
jgi:4-carboxymuconolactone decarboxylase